MYRRHLLASAPVVAAAGIVPSLLDAQEISGARPWTDDRLFIGRRGEALNLAQVSLAGPFATKQT